MTISMIERVARAIVTKIDEIDGCGPSWNASTDEARDEAMKIARAAIEAMRNPTMGMIGMGCGEMPPVQHDGFENAGMIPRDIWQAMIDEALK